MKIHLRFFPTELNGFVPVALEINPFKYAYNSLEYRCGYNYFSEQEVTNKHKEIIKYIDEQLKLQPQVTEKTSNSLELSDDLKHANQEIRQHIYENCKSLPLAQQNMLPIIRPAIDDEYVTSNSGTLVIKLLAPINSTIMDLSALLGDYSNYTTYGLCQGQWHDANSIDKFDRIGLFTADSALLKSKTAIDSALLYADSAENQVKFLKSPNRYIVSDPKYKDNLLSDLDKKYTDVNNVVEECRQALCVLNKIADQITNTNRGSKDWQRAQEKLSQGKQYLATGLRVVENIANLITSSKKLIDALLEELSSDPIKQEQVNKWLFKKRLEDDKNAIYSRLDELNWINMDEKSLSDIDAIIVECNTIKQAMTNLNITGRWVNQHQILMEAITRTRIAKINQEFLAVKKTDFLHNIHEPELDDSIASIKENINPRDVALQPEELNSPVEYNNTTNDNYSISSINLDRNTDEQQSFVKKSVNTVRQLITWVLSSIRYILFYPLNWVYGRPQQSEQLPYNNILSLGQSQQEQTNKSATVTQPPTFTPLMLARAQQGRALKNTIATDIPNQIIRLKHRSESPTI